LVEAGFKAGAIAAGLTFFAVAMLLFPRRLRQNDGAFLAFIHKTGKGRRWLKHLSVTRNSVGL
jgi:hypothetical protein